MCSSTQLSCKLQLWPSTTQSSVHTHIHDGGYAHRITNCGTNQRHSVRGSIQRKLVKTMELQGFSWSTAFNFARESLVIRTRTMSSSVSVTALELLCGFPSVSVLPTVTRNFSKPFSTFRLAPSDQFRTETTSPVTTVIRLIVGSKHSSAFSMKP